MRQKVAICSAYLFDPTAILFDEPLTGLDPHGIRTMKDTVLKRAEQGASVIVSSHLLSMIEDTCTHLLILIKGKAGFYGTMDEVRQAYPELGDGSSLEDIFFRATSDGGSNGGSNSASEETNEAAASSSSAPTSAPSAASTDLPEN